MNNETMKHKSGKQFETATEIDTVLPTPNQYPYGESAPTQTTGTGTGEFIELDGRFYLNPQTGLEESNAFIENLRKAQAEDTARINQQTYALGTQVPSNLGGLSGAEPTFAERYQKPQTEQMIANLKASAQQTALNQALENTLAQYKNQYNQAYRNAYAKAMTQTNSADNENVEKKVVTGEQYYGVGDTLLSEDENFYYYKDAETGAEYKVSKEYMNKLYDENGNLTDEGAVILDTRQLLGL